MDIIVRRPVPNVFDRMQPELDKVYDATPCPNYDCTTGKRRSLPFCIITLDNGLPLILRQGEYEEIKEE